MNVELRVSGSHTPSRGAKLRQIRVCLVRAVLGVIFCSFQAFCAQATTFGELDLGRHPAAGALVQIAHLDGTNPDRPVPRVRGSGCLIHPRIFLTAGHVTDVLDGLIKLNGKAATLDAFAISLGDDAYNNTTWLQIADVFTHPGFRAPPDPAGAGPMTDVGVFILREPVQYVAPVRLAAAGFLDSLMRAGLLRDKKKGSPFTNVGYGTQLLLAPPTLIAPDGLRRVSESSFQTLLDHWLVLSQNPYRGDEGTGFGDSGGPTIWIDPVSGEQTVVAITSRGDMKTIATGFAFRVDTPEVMSFLELAVAFANLP